MDFDFKNRGYKFRQNFNILGDEKDKDGDSYITNIIGSFNGNGNKKLTEIDEARISAAQSILSENLRQKESVSIN